MRKKFRARTICLLCCWLAVSVFAGILFPQTAAISESDPAVSQDILEKNAEAASESDPASPSGQEKGILPPLEETIGRAMPSLGEVLQRYPDSETRHEDGSETDLYLHVTEEEFAAVSVFLEQSGAVLADYQVAGSVMKARIQVNEGSFGLEYDSGRQQIEVQFPAGTYDTRLKSARTHLAAARELYAEGGEAEARKELEKIPQAEAYAPAAKPFEGIQKKEQESSGSEPAAKDPEAGKAEDPASAAEERKADPADAGEEPEVAGAESTPAPTAEPTPAPTATPAPTDEPYVLPEDAARSIQITADKQTVSVGKKLRLKAEITRLKDDAPQSSELEWSSEDPAVAAVSAKGEVDGVKPGSARITVSLKDRPEIRAFLRVNVVQPVKAVKITDKNMMLLVGAAEEKTRGKISASVEPADATVREFIYASSNEAVVKVDGEGNLQAVSPGKARITVKSAEEGSTAKADCTVTVGQAVKSISMARSMTVDKRKTASLKAEVRPKDATTRTLEYKSSNTRVAAVSNNGTITAVGTGTATITAYATDGSGVKATCEVTVIQPVSSVSSKTNKLVFFQGQERTWRPSVEPYDATNKTLRFTSDNSYVASVEKDGKITGKHGGKAKITATSTDGSKRSCTCNIIVEPSAPISLESIGYGIYMGNLLGLTVKNECSTMTIVDFDFDLEFYDYSNRVVNSGSFSLGKDERIGPGRTKTIKRTVYGTGQAYKTVITITGVKFADGTTWKIPASEQKTWSFKR